MNLILRFVRRELRSTEARILVLALALAVASVGAVAMFADRVKGAFANQANVLLGADAMISGDRPLPESFVQQAAAMGLTITESIRFGSMVSTPAKEGSIGKDSVLSDVKSVTSPYPLRGAIEIRGSNGERVPFKAQIKPGEVFVDERLATRLSVKAGDTIEVGKNSPRIAQVFAEEPEVAGNFLSAAPKVLMANADVATSELLQLERRESSASQVVLVGGRHISPICRISVH